MRTSLAALLAFAAAAGPAAASAPKLGNLDIDLPAKGLPTLPAPPDLADKPQLDLKQVKQPLSLPDITIKKGGGLPKFVKGEGASKININVPSLKPLPDVEFEKPDPPPKIVWAKPGKLNLTFQGPKQLVITKPNPPDLSITKVQPPKDKIVIAKPAKFAGTVNVAKTVSKTVDVKEVNLTKPAFNLNITVSKKERPKVRPFFQPGNLNVSVLKFEKYEDTEYSYVKPPQNFSITFNKPMKPRWTKNKEDGSWTETKESKGLTLSGQLQAPGGAGPAEGAFGERTVCRFPDGTNQPQFMEVKKAPAFLANKIADDDLFSFIAPPYGVKVFGPDCYLYDWKCNFNNGLPCSGHGNCLSTFPNQCLCFQGYATCAPVGGSNGCETNIYRDPKNCGGCNVTCPAEAPFCCGMFGCQVSAAVCSTLNTTRATSYLPDNVRAPGTGGVPSEPISGGTVVETPAGGPEEATTTSSSTGGSAGAADSDAAAAALMAGTGDDTSKEDAVAATADPGLGAVGGASDSAASAAAGANALPLAGGVQAGTAPAAYAVPGGMTAAQAAAARAGVAANFAAAAGGGGGKAPAAGGGGAHAGHGAAAAAASSSAPHAGHSQFAPMPGGEATMKARASDAVDVPPPGPVQAILPGR